MGTNTSVKGKFTSLLLVLGAFVVAILTQDGSLQWISGSRVVTALVVMAWFGIMGGGLYFWAKHTRQETAQSETAAAPADGSSSLRQLAQALGPNRAVPVTDAAPAEKASSEETTQKSLP